ncbi:MAG: hypothetical protein FWG66_13300 [Spirochaetes bacterium]|nr:hypothetical protein [Spirochaetota bacterium]
MKKNKIALAAGLALLIALAAYSRNAEKPQPAVQAPARLDAPASVQVFLADVPQDALVGIGSARFATMHQSMAMSENRARVDIARQVNSIAQTTTVTLTQADVSGARTAFQHMEPDGTVWTVVVFDKAKTPIVLAE